MDYLKNETLAENLLTIFGDVRPVKGEEIVKKKNSAEYKGDGYVFKTSFTEHSSGVYKRCDEIKNVSDRDITLTSLLSKFTLNGGEYEVFSQYGQWCKESKGMWQSLVTEVGAETDDVRMSAGASPFVAVYNLQTGRGLSFHILASSIWKFKVRKHFLQVNGTKNVTVELGINDRDFNLKIKPGETFKLPEILYYEFTNKTDLDAYKLHRYCNEVYPGKCQPAVYNSWMSRFDSISFEALSKQLEIAKKIGLEYFVIDAGWFGKPDAWFESVGDWEELKDSSMCGRMKEFSDLVRSSGLKFGLWFEIERAAEKSKCAAEFPEHYIRERNNYFVNFARKETCDYIFKIISDNIKKYDIKYIKFDYNAPLTFDDDRMSFINYYNGFRDFIKRLRKEFPELYLEGCASGGLRMALSNIEDFDSFWMSDDHDMYEELTIFKNTILRMPSRALEKWITIRSLPQFSPVPKINVQDKILMSGDAGWEYIAEIREEFLRICMPGGPLGVSCDVNELTPGHIEMLADITKRHKKEREFYRNAECRILCDTETMLVLQFNDIEFKTVRICAFAYKAEQTAITVYPVCNENSKYSNGENEYSGKELKKEGINLAVGKRYTAEEMTFTKIK